jgi:hypothetical protein
VRLPEGDADDADHRQYQAGQLLQRQAFTEDGEADRQQGQAEASQTV